MALEERDEVIQDDIEQELDDILTLDEEEETTSSEPEEVVVLEDELTEKETQTPDQDSIEDLDSDELKKIVVDAVRTEMGQLD
jgi:hypothetical protein